MPAAEYVATRSDGHFIGKAIRELVRLMTEEGMTWQNAADAVGLKRQRAYKALHKPHVLQYRRERKKEIIELLSTRVPLKLSELMDSENAAAAVRASLALTELSNEAQAEPRRQIATGGIVIVLGSPQPALPAGTAMPVLEMEPAEDE
jgi:uncharacterized NAD(P)/FAD-binding protein YdhS